MKAFKIAFVIAGLTAGSVFAGDFSFTGNLKDGSEVQPFFFTVTEPASVTLQTLSYSGGTNAAGTVIPDGGFDPIITLFNAISGQRIAADDDGGNQLDSFIGGVSEGNYFATVTQYPNFSSGSQLADGFPQHNGGIFGDSHWAVDILNASSAAVGVPYINPIPEPETYAMLVAGLGLLGWRMRSARS